MNSQKGRASLAQQARIRASQKQIARYCNHNALADPRLCKPLCGLGGELLDINKLEKE
jgi:hypothetical protein